MIYRDGFDVAHDITAISINVLEQAAQAAEPVLLRLNYEVEPSALSNELSRTRVRMALPAAPSMLNFTGAQGR